MRRLQPGVPVLFISGYDDGELGEGDELADAELLAKPFRRHELEERLHRLLEPAPG